MIMSSSGQSGEGSLQTTTRNFFEVTVWSLKITLVLLVNINSKTFEC